ncbi:MAG: hypothetical protein ACP5N1_01555 [Candidatus Woesearchaeota archaeon]
MESLQKSRIAALDKLSIADHLVGTTYSLVKEPKLLISVIEHIYNAFDITLTALLEYEKNFKSIPNYKENFDTKIEVFRRKIATKYDISDAKINFIISLKKTLDEHKKASVEFTKKETFVISDNDYNIITLNVDDVKKTLVIAKKYIEDFFKIIKYE